MSDPPDPTPRFPSSPPWSSATGATSWGDVPTTSAHGGSWEFPGGKLEPGESWKAGAARELDEELGLTLVRLGRPLFEARDPDSPFLIRFFEADVTGHLEAREHSAVGWYAPEELARMSLAPSDAAFVATLGEAPAPSRSATSVATRKAARPRPRRPRCRRRARG